MLKNISNLGAVLTKAQLQTINGGKANCLGSNGQCVSFGAGCAQKQCRCTFIPPNDTSCY